jgi:hypothetical protein
MKLTEEQIKTVLLNSFVRLGYTSDLIVILRQNRIERKTKQIIDRDLLGSKFINILNPRYKEQHKAKFYNQPMNKYFNLNILPNLKYYEESAPVSDDPAIFQMLNIDEPTDYLKKRCY